MNLPKLRSTVSLLLLAMFAWGELGAPAADAAAFHRRGGPEAVQSAHGVAVGAARHLAACQLDTAWGTARTPVPTATGAVVPPASTRVRATTESAALLPPRRAHTSLSRAPPVPLG